MKYFLVFLLLVVVFSKLTGRRNERPAERKASSPAAPPSPKPIVSCARCGVHLPQDEALPGRGGVFCSAAHRAEFEAANP